MVAISTQVIGLDKQRRKQAVYLLLQTQVSVNEKEPNIPLTLGNKNFMYVPEKVTCKTERKASQH